jgi:phospholipase C
MSKILAILFFIFLGIIQNSSLAQSDSIKVLSWNVFLRPAILSDGQMKRVDSIAYYLNQSDADVLILQEVFHKRARKRLDELLKENYCSYTDAGPKSIYGVPSGVAIYSRIPLTKEIVHYSYTNGIGSDNLAEKGFIYVQLEVNDTHVGIIGTHLQAGGGEARRFIRRKQFEAIQRFQDSIPDSLAIIYAGDFNIRSTSIAFDSLTSALTATCLPPPGAIRHNSNLTEHAWVHTTGTPKWSDFILLRAHQNDVARAPIIEEPRQIKNGEPTRLSDPNPTLCTVIFSSN